MRRSGWRAALAFAILAGPGPSASLPAAKPAASPSIVSPPRGFVLEGAMRQGNLVRGIVPAGTTGLTLDGKKVPIGEDGRFVLGLDRDHPAETTLVAQLANGRMISERLRVAPRQWRIEHIAIAQRPSAATPEYLRIRERERARIEAARSVGATSQGWRQHFIWPARGRISGVFGSQRIYRGVPASYHSGVDIAAGAGAMVVAPADGVVTLAGPPMFSLEGNLVIIDHGMGLNSAFLHLKSVAVKQGQAVRQGQPVGTVGATGRATGPHLHWGMKWIDARLDPQAVVGAMPK